jgi:hypothetical protein
MKAGILMAAEKPFAGWGAGSAPGALMGYVAEGVRPVADPHNFLIRSWVSWGVPGTAVLLFFLLLWMKTVLGPISQTGWRNTPVGYVGLVLGSLAFLFHSLMDMDFTVPETALYGWIVLGASLGAATVMDRGQVVREPATKKVILRLLAGTVLALVIPGLVFMQGEFTALKADKAMEDGRIEEAAGLYQEARGLLPFHGRFTLEEGRARLALGQKDEALILFERAGRLLRSSPYPSWELGRVALMDGDWEGSIPHLENALGKYPTSPRIHLDLAQANYQLGDYQTTIRLLEEVKRNAFFDPEAMRIAERALDSSETPERPEIQRGTDPIQAR